jgi:alpha-tubulin suppressor-like RCC1 family protein
LQPNCDGSLVLNSLSLELLQCVVSLDLDSTLWDKAAGRDAVQADNGRRTAAMLPAGLVGSLIFFAHGGAAAPISNATAGSLGPEAGAAAWKPGTAVFWGESIVNQETMLVPPAAGKGSNIKALASGDEHVLALTLAGKVLAWGSTREDGAANAAVPVDVAAGVVDAVAAGPAYSVALMRDGRVRCWGTMRGEPAARACVAPVLPTAVDRVAAYWELVVASNSKTGSHYVWQVGEVKDKAKDFRIISQPAGISRIVQGPDATSMLVWDGKGKLAVRTNPYSLPWPLQLSSNVVQVCAGSRTFAAAVTSDGRVQVRLLLICSQCGREKGQGPRTRAETICVCAFSLVKSVSISDKVGTRC